MCARKKIESQAEVFEEKIIDQPLERAIHDYMMPYAESVILDRALPRVEDGLKPVQRRILYTMHELNMKPDGPYKKSARVVGDCLGKYHPHGDTSVYGAMVNLAQDFNMRAPLVDGNGNFGSIDGDSAAAMRYTEVKLAPLACELLRDLDKDTVKWNKNFDDSLKEPDVLPGKFPNLLVNGSAGIAIGLATKIPPHNLTEVIDGTVAVIDNPKITIDELLGIIRGPDFPTGGFIAEGDSFKDIYATGKGKIIMRAKVDIENDNGKQNIIVHEIPYNVNKSALQIKIKELRDDLAEKQGKNSILAGIQEIVDESDRNGIRVAIKLKKGEDATKVLDFLYQKTDLQCNFNVNMIAIADGRPQQLGLIQILKYYIAHQRDVILRRSQFDLNNAKKREHILDGYAIILPDIDNVVQIIKTSGSRSEARDRLRQAYSLSERQADAILDLKLVNLTKLEVGRIEKELAEVKKLIARLTKIVNSKTEQLAVVRNELMEVRNKYRVKRLTTIVDNLDEIEHKPFEASKTATKRGYVLCGADGTLKFAGKVEYLNSGARTKPVDKYDVVNDHVYFDGTGYVYAFTDKGNCVRVDVDEIADGRSKTGGTEIFNLAKDAEIGERCVRLMTFDEKDEDKEIYFFTKNGMVKKSFVREYIVNKNFYKAVVLKDDDEVLNVEIGQDDSSIFMISDDGFCVNVPHEEFNPTGRISGGVIGMSLNNKAHVIFAGQLEQDPIDKVAAGELIFITKTGYAKRVYASNIETMKRARKGDNQMDVKIGDLIFANVVTNAYDVAIIHIDGKVDVVNTEDVQIVRVARSKGKPCPAAEKAVCAVKHCGNV